MGEEELMESGIEVAVPSLDVREGPSVEMVAEEEAIEFSACGIEVVTEELTAPTLERGKEGNKDGKKERRKERRKERNKERKKFNARMAPPDEVVVGLPASGSATEVVVDGDVSLEAGVEIIASADLVVEGEEICMEPPKEVVEEELMESGIEVAVPSLDVREGPSVEMMAEEEAIEFSARGIEVVTEELTAPTLERRKEGNKDGKKESAELIAPTVEFAPWASPDGVVVELSAPDTEIVVEGAVSVEPGVEIIAPTEVVEGECRSSALT